MAALVSQVIEAASPGEGISQAGQAIAAKLIEHDHQKVVEVILPLLEHKQKGVSKLAGYIILECRTGLDPHHFDALKKGYLNGGGWLPGAIAELKTDEATAFLVAEFRKNPETEGQLDQALAGLGEQSVPRLLAELQQADPKKDAAFFDGVRNVFKLMKGKAKIAIPRLMQIAKDSKYEGELRKQAALTIGFIGEPAEEVFPQLLALSHAEPQVFCDIVRRSIIASGTASTARVLADQVDEGADHYTIREIALLGNRAKSVGPRVMGWLHHPSWGSRVMAARTIGAIGYQDGRESLEKLLSVRTDWRLVYAAVKSLRDLKAKESIPALAATARNYWFPIVRNAASSAITVLQEGRGLEDPGLTPAASLVHYVFVDRDALSVPTEQIVGLSGPKGSIGRREAFSAFAERDPKTAERFIRLRNSSGDGWLGVVGRIISFPTGDGLLLGATAGEWVGGLQYAPEKGEQRVILSDNITGIEKWHDEIFIVSGIYHMGMNEGIVHMILKENGKLSITPWFILPGQPTGMWITIKDQLVIECIGGTLVFSDHQNFEYYSGSPGKASKTRTAEKDGIGQQAARPESK